MTVVLQVRGQSIESHQIVSLLANYQLLGQFVRDLIIDQEIKDITCTPEELEAGYKSLYAQHQLKTEQQLATWLEQRQISRQQMGLLIERSLRIEKYKQITWGNKLETYFLSRKADLDRVIYSLIRVKDGNMAQELYFRLKEEEQTFAELAAKYSQGIEAQTQGILGPIEMSRVDLPLAQLLLTSPIGQISTPRQIGEWLVIVRLEKLIPAQMDQVMSQNLLTEMFNTWLQSEVSKFQFHQEPVTQ
jgi:parvulin-like peptidyl-prolyl isomerase